VSDGTFSGILAKANLKFIDPMLTVPTVSSINVYANTIVTTNISTSAGLFVNSLRNEDVAGLRYVPLFNDTTHEMTYNPKINISKTTTTANTRLIIVPELQTSSMVIGTGSVTTALTTTTAGSLQCDGNFIPLNTAYTLGTTLAPWGQLFATNTTIATSDRRMKTDIVDSYLGLDFINKLRPVQYKFIESSNAELTNEFGNTFTSSMGGVRTHFGLISQDVQKTLAEENINGAMWVLADPTDANSKQALRYSEFIGPHIKATQDIDRQLQATIARVSTLENIVVVQQAQIDALIRRVGS
jgi:hypothetical protein